MDYISTFFQPIPSNLKPEYYNVFSADIIPPWKDTYQDLSENKPSGILSLPGFNSHVVNLAELTPEDFKPDFSNSGGLLGSLTGSNKPNSGLFGAGLAFPSKEPGSSNAITLVNPSSLISNMIESAKPKSMKSMISNKNRNRRKKQ